MSTSEIHLQAEEFREAGDFDKALEAYQKAISYYLKEEDYANLAEAYGGESVTYKLLFQFNQDKKIFITLALNFALLSLKILVSYRIKNRIHRAYFRLGEIEAIRSRYRKAYFFYRIAHKLTSADSVEKGNILYHLGFAEYKIGAVSTGLLHMFLGEQTIIRLNQKLDTYVYNVWLSGAAMRIAEALRQEDPKTSNEYFQKALSIVNSDDRLILRRQQLKNLASRIGYPSSGI